MDEQQTPSVKEQTPKQQVVEALKGANNVLITISKNPTVDQLAACIGLTLMLNKLDKHATAVFSGVVPSTLEFLQPEKTIETNTDSLRDFIISLDKSKADKLRYKVEDDVVRIYITPYRTSISAADLEFTQGNFNVDVVVALGIDNKDELDAAIIEHGLILHDATVIDMSCGNNRPVDMGSINWHELTASSLSEMLVSISEAFKTGLLDTQMSTAFLTGIVAETDRFSNEKTTPKVMTISAQLMAAGANQQLIANQLAIQPEPEPEPEPIPEPVEEALAVVQADGELDINQTPEPAEEAPVEEAVVPAPPAELNVSKSDDGDVSFDLHKEEDHTTTNVNEVADSLGASGKDVTNTHVETDEQGNVIQPPEIEIDEHGNMIDLAAAEEEKKYIHKQRVIQPLNVEPPKPKTDLSNFNFDAPDANVPSPATDETPPVVGAEPEVVAAVEPVSAEPVTEPALPTETPQQEAAPIESSEIVPEVITDEPTPEQTLADLEKAVDSPHLADPADAARDAIAGAVGDAPAPSFDLPAEVTDSEQRDNTTPPPPPVPPPFVPPYMQPQKNADDELNLPSPQ
jgi:hypothetical protein